MNTFETRNQSVPSLWRVVFRFPLTIFFLLTYLFSWWSIPFGGQIPHGPALAAVIVLALTEGRLGLAQLWRQFAHWRVRWYWYLVAPGIIALYHLLALALNLLQGATALNPVYAEGWQPLLMLLTLLLLGGEWEELGWSGYALPHLQERFARLTYGPLIAGLIVGVFRAVWHLPLMAYGYIPWYDVLFLSFAMQITITWLYNRTRGSLPVVMLFHLTSNIAGGVMPFVFAGPDYAHYNMLFVALACLCALVILGASGPALGKQGK